MTSLSKDLITKKLYLARKYNNYVDTKILYDKTFGELYEISQKLEIQYNKSQTKCIKLGSSTRRSREVFNNKSIIYGPIINRYLYHQTDLIGNVSKAEAEIFFKVKDNFKKREARCFLDIFSHYGYAIDFPFSCLEKNEFPYFIADLCGSGKAVISKAYEITNFNEHEKIELMTKNKISTDSFHNQFIFNQEDFLNELFKSLNENSRQLVGGQIILSGGITSCLDLTNEKNVKLNVEGRNIFDLNLIF